MSRRLASMQGAVVSSLAQMDPALLAASLLDNRGRHAAG